MCVCVGEGVGVRSVCEVCVGVGVGVWFDVAIIDIIIHFHLFRI